MAQKKKVLVTTARGTAGTTNAKGVPQPTAKSKPVAGKPASTKVANAKTDTLARNSTASERKLSKNAAVNSKSKASKNAVKKAAPVDKPAAKASAKPAATETRKPIEKGTMPAAALRAGRTAPARQRAMTAAMTKPAQPKISAPVTPRDVAAKAKEIKQGAQSKKAIQQRHGFKTNEYIVYPTHGVGRIVGIEEQEIAGMSLELFVITFEKDKMTLRVPTGKLETVGMRKLAEEDIVSKAMDTLKGRARVKRTMWSRRAQEYEAKINSGDLVAIAEVVRDLYRSESQPEQSYSERQLYEAALDRMAREIAAVEKLDERGAVQRITDVLSKSARGRRAAAEAEASEDEDPEVKAA